MSDKTDRLQTFVDASSELSDAMFDAIVNLNKAAAIQTTWRGFLWPLCLVLGHAWQNPKRPYPFCGRCGETRYS